MLKKHSPWLAVIVGVIGMVMALACNNKAVVLPPDPIPSPTPGPIQYIPKTVATQGGVNGFVTDVNAGENFKTTVQGVTCVQDGAAVKCPIFGGYRWRQVNAPLGTCSDAGSQNSGTDSWTCGDPTVPGSAEFEGCVLDFNDTILGCDTVKVRVH